MTEDQLEQQCLQWFSEGGWEIALGPDLAPDGAAPERADYRQVLLLADLEAAIRRINPHLPQSAVDQVVAVVRKPESLDVVISNRAFHRLLMDGVPVEYKRNDKRVHDRAFLLDFADLESNRFRAVSQFTLEGTKQLRRPDVICFINGLPVRKLSKSSEKFSITRADIKRNASGAVDRNHHCITLSVPSTIWKLEADSTTARKVVTITIMENPIHSRLSRHRQAN